MVGHGDLAQRPGASLRPKRFFPLYGLRDNPLQFRGRFIVGLEPGGRTVRRRNHFEMLSFDRLLKDLCGSMIPLAQKTLCSP